MMTVVPWLSRAELSISKPSLPSLDHFHAASSLA